jgi:hypothetical protein
LFRKLLLAYFNYNKNGSITVILRAVIILLERVLKNYIESVFPDGAWGRGILAVAA